MRRTSLVWFFCALALGVLPVCAEERGEFAKQGVSFLKKHCLDCHNETTQEGELRLDTFADEAALIKGRKTWEKLLERVQAGEMPPEERPRPAAADVNAFVGIVTEVFARADREAKSDPGRVTVRRLNRTEYANTIRDLIGVDFNPAEDFPSDDIGHGFDNIGDVLTLPPVLMERYLSAADAIVQRAIVIDPPPPTISRIRTRTLEPMIDTGGGQRRRGRVIDPQKSDSAREAGPLHAAYLFNGDFEYTLRFRAMIEEGDGAVVQMALLACGERNQFPDAAPDVELEQFAGPAVQTLRPARVLQIFDVRSRTEDKADTFEITLRPGSQVKRIAIAVRKPLGDLPAPKVRLLQFDIVGPLDTRPASQHKLLAAAPGVPQPEQTRAIVTRFASRAYRRPATPAEVDRLVKLVEQTVAGGEKWEAGIQRAFQAVLVSPKFLFRFELDDRPEAAEIRPLDEFQLASRLSYFLWSSLPDDELFDLAAKNQLMANIEPQVKRMLKDRKATALTQNFAMQWLQLQRLKIVTPDSKQFPRFNETLRQSMLKETELFFAEIVREDRSLLELVDADFTYLNEPLARLYGIADTAGNRRDAKPGRPEGERIRGDEFVRVSLQGKERGGLLTQASMLTVTSNPTRTSPVKRGRWVLEQILGTPPPAPPPNVPELEEGDKVKLTGTLRQRLEQHRANPSCANCHAKMDPIGFAFENFDAIGQWRTKDGEFDIDSAASLPDGTSFQGVAELKAMLKDKRKDQLRRCVAEKLLTYALGRGLEYYDRPTLARIEAALATDDRFSQLVLEIVNSDPFRLRRGISELME